MPLAMPESAFGSSAMRDVSGSTTSFGVPSKPEFS